MRTVDALWRFFCSLKLTAILIALLMAGAFVGMFVDQTVPYEQHMAALAGHPLQQRLFTLFEVYNLFGSWWFMMLVLLLALNLMACTINRLPGIWKQVFGFDSDWNHEHLAQLSQTSVAKGASLDEGLALGQRLLRRCKVKVQRREREGGGVLLYGERHGLSRFAVVAVHLSLLLILFGHVANSITGIDGSIVIPEESQSSTLFLRGPAGLTKRVDLGFAVRCTDFRVEKFKSGMPKDYESDLIIVDGGKEGPHKTIRVNDPLQYAGFTFYQSSYQPLPGEERVRLRVGLRGSKLEEHELAIGDRLELGDVTLVPVETNDNMGGFGPALRLNRVAKDGATQGLVLFQRFQDLDATRRKGTYDIRYLGSDQRYATVLSVGNAPMTSVVFVGFTLMILGSLWGLLFSHRRYWVELRPSGNNKYELLFAAMAKKHKGGFKIEFERLAAWLSEQTAKSGAKKGAS